MSRGGPRPGAGRKSGGKKLVSVSVRPEVFEYLERVGNGNAQVGLVKVAEAGLAGEPGPAEPAPQVHEQPLYKDTPPEPLAMPAVVPNGSKLCKRCSRIGTATCEACKAGK